MKPLDISFDIDGTILDNTDPDGRRPNLPMLNLIRFFAKRCKNVAVHIYSGRPIEQQRDIVNRLGLEAYVTGLHVKGCGWTPDVHFDDQHEVQLGHKNVIVRMK